MSSHENVLTPAPVVGHGNTPAAWTLVLVCTVGVLIGAIAFDMHNAFFTWIGVAVTVLGLLIGLLMKAAGLGKNGSRLKPSHH